MFLSALVVVKVEKFDSESFDLHTIFITSLTLYDRLVISSDIVHIWFSKSSGCCIILHLSTMLRFLTFFLSLMLNKNKVPATQSLI